MRLFICIFILHFCLMVCVLLFFCCFYFDDIERGGLFDMSQFYIKPSKMVFICLFLRKRKCFPFNVQC